MTRDDFHSALMQEGGTSSRRAALLLHGLHASDRTWLLERLDAAQRAMLTGLLDELTVLGVPSNAARGQPTTRSVAATAPRASSTSVSPIRAAAERIMRTPMADVVAVLRREPDALIARVMPHLHPAWSPRFLSHLDAARRIRIVARSAEAAGRMPAEALDLAILQAIGSRVGRRTARSRVRDGIDSATATVARRWQALRSAGRAPSEVAS